MKPLFQRLQARKAQRKLLRKHQEQDQVPEQRVVVYTEEKGRLQLQPSAIVEEEEDEEHHHDHASCDLSVQTPDSSNHQNYFNSYHSNHKTYTLNHGGTGGSFADDEKEGKTAAASPEEQPQVLSKRFASAFKKRRRRKPDASTSSNSSVDSSVSPPPPPAQEKQHWYAHRRRQYQQKQHKPEDQEVAPSTPETIGTVISTASSCSSSRSPVTTVSLPDTRHPSTTTSDIAEQDHPFARSSAPAPATPNSRYQPLVEEEEEEHIRELLQQPDFVILDADERNRIARAAAALDKSGNDLFEQGLYDEAFLRYERALYLKRRSLQESMEAQQQHPHDEPNGRASRRNSNSSATSTVSTTAPMPLSSVGNSHVTDDVAAMSLSFQKRVAVSMSSSSSMGHQDQNVPCPLSSEQPNVNNDDDDDEVSRAAAAAASEDEEEPRNPESAQKKSILASVATSINNMTYLKHRAGVATADETMASYMKSLKIKRDILGPEHLSVGKTLNNIGSVFYLKEEFEPALAAYKDAYRIMKGKLGPHHLDVVTVISNIGDVHYSKGEWEEALERYREAVQIRWGMLGPKHPKVTRLMEQIAHLETGMQPRKQDGELSDSEGEEFKEEDRRRHQIFQEDVRALQEELEEDMKFFDLMERQSAIDMIRDRTKLMREMRQFSTGLSSASAADMDPIRLVATPAAAALEAAPVSPTSETADEDEETRQALLDRQRSVSSRLTPEERVHALSLIKKRVEKLKSMRSSSSVHSSPHEEYNDDDDDGDDESEDNARSEASIPVSTTTTATSSSTTTMQQKQRPRTTKKTAAVPSYMRATVASKVRTKTPPPSPMVSPRVVGGGKVPVPVNQKSGGLPLAPHRLMEDGIRALQRTLPPTQQQQQQKSKATGMARPNPMPAAATATG